MKFSMSGRIEIRFHGRGGQGIVTAARILAITYIKMGYNGQAMPHFGAERRGAPVEAYVRIDKDRPIYIRSPVRNPDVLVFIDPTVISKERLEGLKENGTLVVNTDKSPEEIKKKYSLPSGVKVVTVDATKIALEVLKANYFNTPTLGAVAKVLGTDLKALEEAVIEYLGENIGRLNVEAIKKAYEEVKM